MVAEGRVVSRCKVDTPSSRLLVWDIDDCYGLVAILRWLLSGHLSFLLLAWGVAEMELCMVLA